MVEQAGTKWQYYSDETFGEKPQVKEEIDEAVWNAIRSYVKTLASRGWFALDYPEHCIDGPMEVDTDWDAMQKDMVGEIPGASFDGDAPDTITILDMLTFCFEHVARATKGWYHDYGRHHHLDFDVVEGRDEFRDKINRIFRRNGLAFLLSETGSVHHLTVADLRQDLALVYFETGDQRLNELLEKARTKFLDSRPEVRLEALEAVWDAWERLKTLGDGTDK
ncbi:MAG: hypothetical protein F4152_03180, partial [Dehalococcoidia bacterium]|nr:hypothetical protein [Dehalococcoidia bacterium]